MTHKFEFGGQQFALAGDAALYWPQQQALFVSDLHLEKASAYAASGQMLPPYDSLATLQDIAALVAQFRPAQIISLGDNFHDDEGEVRLAGAAAQTLEELVRNTYWLWITGNHDRGIEAKWGGRSVAEITLSGIILRHEAEAGETAPEISGHFHPKFRQNLRGRMVARRCFVKSPRKLIMPAFGALTGGLDVHDIAIIRACDLAGDEFAEALVPTKSGISRFQLTGSASFAK
jgi:uncharacterized protein